MHAKSIATIMLMGKRESEKKREREESNRISIAIEYLHIHILYNMNHIHPSYNNPFKSVEAHDVEKRDNKPMIIVLF